jgi:hypothetical protein
LRNLYFAQKRSTLKVAGKECLAAEEIKEKSNTITTEQQKNTFREPQGLTTPSM